MFYKRDDGSHILHRIVGKENDAFTSRRWKFAGISLYANQIIGVATDFVSRGKGFHIKTLFI